MDTFREPLLIVCFQRTIRRNNKNEKIDPYADYPKTLFAMQAGVNLLQAAQRRAILQRSLPSTTVERGCSPSKAGLLGEPITLSPSGLIKIDRLGGKALAEVVSLVSKHDASFVDTAVIVAPRGRPQVIRMKISGHKTDSRERRYNIVYADDINMARELLQDRQKAASARI